MRTIVDIPSELLTPLDQYARERDLPRAAVIREALGAYLSLRTDSTKEIAFGLWKDRVIDGVEYQRNIRAEWDNA